jgi:hypothetical protein
VKFAAFSAFLISAALLPQAAYCSDFGAAEAVTPHQAAVIDATCSRVMGLQKGEMQYDACVDSLSQSAGYLASGRETSQSRDSCEKSGLKEGTPDFSMCILNDRRDAAANDSDAGPVRLAYDAPRKSYFDMTPSERWKIEQASCAQLGLDPGGPAFSHCVASLDTDVSSPDE